MDKKTGWIEKRQFERIVATLKVDYRMVDSKDSKKALEHDHYKLTKAEHLPELARKSPLYHAVTKDISMGGLAILGEQPFPMGAVVEVSLHLPKYKSVLKFMTQVCRTESFVEMGRTIHRAGLQTLAINQADLDRIEKFILSQKNS
jgi:hypothetical protein